MSALAQVCSTAIGVVCTHTAHCFTSSLLVRSVSLIAQHWCSRRKSSTRLTSPSTRTRLNSGVRA
eukprot:16767-Heterococcus_DN1.PRE.3